MEVSGTLGVGILSAKFWGDSVRVYLPGENAFLQGRAATVLYQVTGVDLSYYDVQRVLLGLPTFEPSAYKRVIGFRTDTDHYVIELQYDRWIRRSWISRVDLSVMKEEIIDAHGVKRSQLRLWEYRVESGCRLPRKFNISQGMNQIEFNVATQKVNTGLRDHLFEQRIPPAAKPLDTGEQKNLR